MGQVTQHPTETEMHRTVSAVNLIDSGSYEELRKGNIVATSEGFAVKYEDNCGSNVFVGYLGEDRDLSKFAIVSVDIRGGVLNIKNSDRVEYIRITPDEKSNLIEALRNAGIRK